ncbi:OsmC family protein [Pseudonocardia sp. ICBG601]|uniref:OsmC family protein n=1 Tax=Pseudonocardia sp. ICBG601 TaxID=2846759 RepID=UPI0035ABB287
MTDTNVSLRDIQAPLKQQYRDDPESAVITLKADGDLGSGVACKVSTGQAMAEAGLHPATGGDGTQLCSGDMLLEALVACAGVTLRAVATALELEVHGAVRAEGDLDFRGHARRREGRPGRVPGHPAVVRRRHPRRRRARGAGQGRDPGEADRAVLRRPADHPGQRGPPRSRSTRPPDPATPPPRRHGR